MAKYNYDKKALKGLTPFPFLGEVATRTKAIEAAPETIPESVFNPNKVGKSLHPHVQFAKVAKVIDEPDAKAFILVADKDRGTEKLAYFRAGQYISVVVNIDRAIVTKPYTLASDPKAALGKDSYYRIMVKKADKGYASDYIRENWKEGTEIVISGPLGNYYYQELRDAKKVIAASGGSGITPFISMAYAVASGIENFDLTILCGNKTWDSIAFRDELAELEKNSGGKVKVVHVLSEEERDGCEQGFISADIIKKYAGEVDYSLFICGNKAFYKYMHTVVDELGLTGRRARFEVGGEYGDPSQNPSYSGDKNAVYDVKVLARGTSYSLKCKGDETLLHAIQSAGITVTSDCRSGICGWCHSRLICGNVFIPDDADGRREADKKFGWIHPCVTYPLSDIEMEVFPIM